MDHYKTLCIGKDASAEEIKKAYRKLSMEHHPDKGGDEEEFKKISEAYTILSDPRKKAEYDNPNPFGDIFGGPGMGFPFNYNPFSGREYTRPNPDTPKDGKLILLETRLPLKIYLFGGKFKVTLSFREHCTDCSGKGYLVGETCAVCNGRGFVQEIIRRGGFTSSSTRHCSSCQGNGEVAKDHCESCNGKGSRDVVNKEVIFDIPQNTEIGSRIVSSSTGRVGINGGRTGDICLIIVGINRFDINKLTSERVEQLKELLDEMNS